MLRIRIASMSALAAIAVALAGSAASAQSATTERPGQPLALLAGLNPPHQSKSHAARAHAAKASVGSKTVHVAQTHHARAAKIASKTAIRRSGTVATNEEINSRPPSAAPENKWPAPEDKAPANASATPPVADATPPRAPDDSDPSALVVDGQTVQISSPDAVNDIDRAAAGQSGGAQSADANAPASMSDNDLQPSLPAAMTRVAAAAVSDDAGQNASRSASTSTSPVGSTSWIAQVLAALGGAVAAGSVAWFLIGSGPVRNYG